MRLRSTSLAVALVLGATASLVSVPASAAITLTPIFKSGDAIPGKAATVKASGPFYQIVQSGGNVAFNVAANDSAPGGQPSGFILGRFGTGPVTIVADPTTVPSGSDVFSTAALRSVDAAGAIFVTLPDLSLGSPAGVRTKLFDSAAPTFPTGGLLTAISSRGTIFYTAYAKTTGPVELHSFVGGVDKLVAKIAGPGTPAADFEYLDALDADAGGKGLFVGRKPTDAAGLQSIYFYDGSNFQTLATSDTAVAALPGGKIGSCISTSVGSLDGGEVAIAGGCSGSFQNWLIVLRAGGPQVISVATTPIPERDDTFSNYQGVALRGGVTYFTGLYTKVPLSGLYKHDASGISRIWDASIAIEATSYRDARITNNSVDGTSVAFIVVGEGNFPGAAILGTTDTGAGGSGGSGGAAGSGAGGTGAAGSGGATAGSGGSDAAGAAGAAGSGTGGTGTGGAAGTGTGGTTSAGAGGSDSAGAGGTPSAGTGGTTTAGTGGTTTAGTGGTTSAAGTGGSATGGTSSGGAGRAGSAAGGRAGSAGGGGAGTGAATADGDDGGCSCRVAGIPDGNDSRAIGGIAMAMLAFVARRRRVNRKDD